MKDKVTFEQACEGAAEWLRSIGVDPCRISYKEFDQRLNEWLAANSLQIN